MISGIRRGDDYRPIDDFSEFLVNQTVGFKEKVVGDGLEEVVSIIRLWAEALGVLHMGCP